jgi:hypothetical protein
MRRVDVCLNCQDPREIVSHGLCARCLMAHRRAEEKTSEPTSIIGPDRSQHKAQRDLNKMGVNFFKMLLALTETPISALIVTDEEYEIVKANLITWIGRIHDRQKLTVLTQESKLTVISKPE